MWYCCRKTMKINLSWQRICHLILLSSSTYALGKLLIRTLEWTPLSAYGFGCTVIVQINNAILSIIETEVIYKDNRSKDVIGGRERGRERRKQKGGGRNRCASFNSNKR